VSLKRNFSYGFINSVWTTLLSIVMVPFYIKYLGTESYGLIGFFVTSQILLQLLDLGLSSTLNREVAKCSAAGDMREARNLLHTLAVVYWVMAVVIAIIMFLLAPLLAKHWLQPEHLSQSTVINAITLMGFSIACRWPSGLYGGALMGLQKIALLSSFGSIVATISGFGAICILAFISPTIEAFFIWQTSVGFVSVIVLRFITWREMNSIDNPSQFSLDSLVRIWRFSAGMSAIAVAAAVLMQIDKVLLSKLLSLEDFGKYSLAWVIANGLYVLLIPIFNVIYPRFTILVAKGDTKVLMNLYRLVTRLLTSVLFPMAVLAGVFAEDILYIWTGNETLAREVAPVARLLLIGSAINGVMIFPYALQLAYGAIRMSFKICLILIILTVPMTIFLAQKFGTLGGAYSWVIMTSIYLFMGSFLTYRFMLKEIGMKWLMWDVLIPLVSSILVLSILGGWVRELGMSHMINILIAIFIGLIAVLLLFLSSPSVRRALLDSLKEKDFGLKTFLNRRFF
jgi:O-antigen/teichoic acid export membrane protein